VSLSPSGCCLSCGSACGLELLLPHLAGVEVERAGQLPGLVCIWVRARSACGTCPRCGVASSRAGQSLSMSEITPEERKLEDRLETLDLINTEVTATLTQLAEGSAKLETKAMTLVGYAGALSAFLATRHPQPALAALAYLAYAVAAGFGIMAFMAGPGLRMVGAPEPRTLSRPFVLAPSPGWGPSRCGPLAAWPSHYECFRLD